MVRKTESPGFRMTRYNSISCFSCLLDTFGGTVPNVVTHSKVPDSSFPRTNSVNVETFRSDRQNRVTSGLLSLKHLVYF